MLSLARFSRYIVTVRLADGALTEVERLTYESTGALYDVDIYFGAIADVRVNCRSVKGAHPIHRAIALHYKRDIAF